MILTNLPHAQRMLSAQTAIAEYSTNRITRAGAAKLMREAGLDDEAITQLLAAADKNLVIGEVRRG